VMEHGVPIRAYMKDIAEESSILNPDVDLPQRDQSAIHRALYGGKCDSGANVRLSSFSSTDRIATGQPDTRFCLSQK